MKTARILAFQSFVTKPAVVETEIRTRMAVWLMAGLLKTTVAGVRNSVHLREKIRFICYKENRRRNLDCGPELVGENSKVPELKLNVNQMVTNICRKPVEKQELEQETRFVSVRK